MQQGVTPLYMNVVFVSAILEYLQQHASSQVESCLCEAERWSDARHEAKKAQQCRLIQNQMQICFARRSFAICFVLLQDR